MSKATKYVYFFGAGQTEGNADMRNLLGGKGANLAEMASLGLPVPQGFTISTEACTRYYDDGRKIGDDIMRQVQEYVGKLEKSAGKKFGDAKNPLLVSVRSGARASMPGMMDTILNLGLNETVVNSLAKQTKNPRWAWDCYRRFIQMFSDVVMEVGKKYFEQLIDQMKEKKGVTLDVELTADDLGYADTVELKKIEDEEMTFITGVKEPKTVSIMVRGGTKHVADEVERSLVDAWSVVRVAIEDGMMVTGGGSTAMEIAMQLRDYAASVGGREQIAIEAYASAMESIPRTLAENAGLDPIDVLIEMRKQHKAGKKYAGLNPYSGKVEDMKKLNVIEPYRIGKQAINSATDAAIMILRIDDVIAAKGSPAPQVGEGGMPPGMDE